MKKILVFCLVLGLSSAATASVTFYVAPTTYNTLPIDSTLDVPWQTAVGSFTEFDLDGYAKGTDLDFLTAGSLTIDVGLGGLGGTASTAEIFAGAWGDGSVYGTVYGMGLLNRDSAEGPHGEITFSFSDPVTGFGAWVFDNSKFTNEMFVMTVTEVGGATFTSGVLDSGNGSGNHWIEGWLGATSSVGITNASIVVLDGGSLQPTGDSYFELDHLQVAPLGVIPAPGAILLGSLGIGIVGWLRRRKVL